VYAAAPRPYQGPTFRAWAAIPHLPKCSHVVVLISSTGSRLVYIHIKLQCKGRYIYFHWLRNCNAHRVNKVLKMTNVSCDPVGARFKAWVCGCSLAGMAGSNPAGGMDVSCECCVLSGRGLCVGLIIRPEKSCRLWCV
jgi:hypothetical protein